MPPQASAQTCRPNGVPALWARGKGQWASYDSLLLCSETRMPSRKPAPVHGWSGLATPLSLLPLSGLWSSSCPENCMAQETACQTLLGINNPVGWKEIIQDDGFPELLGKKNQQEQGGRVCVRKSRESQAETPLAHSANAQPEVVEKGRRGGGWESARPNQGLAFSPSTWLFLDPSPAKPCGVSKPLTLCFLQTLQSKELEYVQEEEVAAHRQLFCRSEIPPDACTQRCMCACS